MNDWVNWHALWQIVVLGLVCGAGLPALFAVGLVALNTGNRVQTAGAGGAGRRHRVRRRARSTGATRSASSRPVSASRSCSARSGTAST